MTTKSLDITLPGRRVGELTQDRTGLTAWRPEPIWESDGQHPRLGVEFLRRPGPRRVGTGLPTWFENLLPEMESPLRRRLCAAYELREGQSFALLKALGHDLSGAVEAHQKGADVADGDDVNDGRAESAPTASARRFSALAGMQLKFTMSMVNQRMTLPAHGRGGLWIVKLPGRDYDELPEVEDATMHWAACAGFDVPKHFTLDADRLEGIPDGWIEGAPRAFAIRRFDRNENGDKEHVEDLCQALDLRPANKYGDVAPKVTLDGALRFVTDVCGEAEGREMSRRIGFMIASGNTDAHLKNWSLFWGTFTRPKLTPCYDLVATISWDKLGWHHHPNGPSLALRFGGEDRFHLVDAKCLDAHAKNTRLPWAVDEALAGIRAASESWRHASGRAPTRMRQAVEEHWRRVPLLRDLGLRE